MTVSTIVEPTAHIARLGARQRAVRLQRRRFWREVVYGGMVVASDAVTLAAVFIILAMVPLAEVGALLGPDGTDFLRFLLPSDPVPLARRLGAMVFCLVATRSYTYTERSQHSRRIMAALLVGLALPRWTEIWTSFFVMRAFALTGVLAALWGALVLQRRVITGALKSIDPRGLEPSRTLIAGIPDVLDGVRQDWKRRLAETDEQVAPGFFESSDAGPSESNTPSSSRGFASSASFV